MSRLYTAIFSKTALPSPVGSCNDIALTDTPSVKVVNTLANNNVLYIVASLFTVDYITLIIHKTIYLLKEKDLYIYSISIIEKNKKYNSF